jgi:hypothetical protein
MSDFVDDFNSSTSLEIDTDAFYVSPRDGRYIFD